MDLVVVVKVDLVAFFEEHVVGHVKGKEFIDLVVVAQCLAAVEEVGCDDGFDEMAVVAVFVEGDALVGELLAERVVGECVAFLIDALLEHLLTHCGVRRQACDDLGFHFAFQALPFAVVEVVPTELVDQLHLFEGWAFDVDASLLEQMTQVVEFREDFGRPRNVFAVIVFPIQQVFVLEFEVGLVERLGRKELKVVMNEVKAVPQGKGDLVDLDQEASVVGPAAFIGGEQIGSLFEIGFQDLELIF